MRAGEIISARLMIILIWMFADFGNIEKCITRRNNEAAVQVCCKIPTCAFQYCVEEKNVHRFRNSDKCRDTTSCAKLSSGSGCPWAVTQLEPGVSFSYSHPLWPFILAVCCLCRTFAWIGVCSCVHSLRLSKPNMGKSSHTTPNSAVVPTPHRVLQSK